MPPATSAARLPAAVRVRGTFAFAAMHGLCVGGSTALHRAAPHQLRHAPLRLRRGASLPPRAAGDDDGDSWGACTPLRVLPALPYADTACIQAAAEEARVKRGPRTDGWADIRRSMAGIDDAAPPPRPRRDREATGPRFGGGGYMSRDRSDEPAAPRERAAPGRDGDTIYVPSRERSGDDRGPPRREYTAQPGRGRGRGPPRGGFDAPFAGRGRTGYTPLRRDQREERERDDGRSRFGEPGDLNLSGAARRVREKALRESGLSMSGDELPARRERAPRDDAPPWRSAEGGRSSAPGPRGDSGRGAGRGAGRSAGAGRGAFAPPAKPKPWERPEARALVAEAIAEEMAEPELPLPPVNPGHANLFVRLGLVRSAGEALTEAGITTPTPIQQLAIPALLKGGNAAVLAETGSGKTLTYCLPLLTRLYARQLTGRRGIRRSSGCACPELLFVVPTRELGVQVAATAESAAAWCAPPSVERPAGVLELLGKDKHAVKLASRPPPRRDFISTAAAADNERKAEKKEKAENVLKQKLRAKITAPDAEARAAFQSADVVVATPRAVLDLVRADRVRLDRLRAVVIDEADELLASGFEEDVRALLLAAAGVAGIGQSGQPVQVVFAAATMARADWDTKLRAAFRGQMERLASAGLHRSAPGVTQRVMRVRGDSERMSALLETLVAEGDDEGGIAPGLPALVFTNSTEEADALTERLVAAGLPAAAFHGRVKGARGELLDELQAGELAVLVATDFAARGLDLPQVRHVVQWRPAASPALHLHRIGRTGRASATGPCAATTLFDPDDPADAASAMAPVLAAAEQQGWEVMGELLDTRRKASGEE